MGSAKKEIAVFPDKCTGCQTCRLICSLTWEGLFKPSSARIIISGKPESRAISFSEECRRCGKCANYCPYGALEGAEAQ